MPPTRGHRVAPEGGRAATDAETTSVPTDGADVSTQTRLRHLPDTITSRRPRYPTEVDETIARITAGQVVALNTLVLTTPAWWLLALVAGDDLIRAAAGPRFSPLARLATLAASELELPARGTPAPLKRFAATIGSAFMLTATALGLLGQPGSALVVGGVMVLLPAVESFLGFCVGCYLFGRLMKLAWYPSLRCLRRGDRRRSLRLLASVRSTA